MEAPGPPRRFLGALFDLQRDPLTFLMRTAREFGPVAQFRVGPRRVMMLTDPAHIEHVLKDRNTNYGKQTRGFQKLRLALGQGLLTSEGELWRTQRRIAQPAFHRERIAHFAKVMVEETETRMREWQDGTQLDLASEMMALTLRIIARTQFSADFSEKLQKTIGDAVTTINVDLIERTLSFPDFPLYLPTPANRRLKRALGILNELIFKEIERRRGREEELTDLLSMLMQARDEHGQPMTVEQLRDEFVTMTVAGHETTANAMAWTFYLLSRHPQVARRLKEELAGLSDRPRFEDLPSLTYTRAVVQESMRLYPPVWVLARNAIEDDVIGGYSVRAGTILMLPPYVVHRNPHFWKNPEGFDPERFMTEDPARPRFAYFPFGGGPRQCIGMSFAMMEAQLILATIAQKFELEVAPGFQPLAQPLITLRPRDGMPMTVRAHPTC